MEKLVDIFNWRTEFVLCRDYIDTGHDNWASLPPLIVEEAPAWARLASPSPEQVVIRCADAVEGFLCEQILWMWDPPSRHFLKTQLDC